MCASFKVTFEPGPPEAAVWRNMPEPRQGQGTGCEVVLQRRQWCHIAEKHVADRSEPWEEVLPPEVVARLRQAGCSEQLRADELNTAAERLGPGVFSGLRAQLVIGYDYPQRGHVEQVWLLVLPCGATLVIYLRLGGNYAWTCFFRGLGDSSQGEPRFYAVARHLRSTYALVQPDGTWKPKECERVGDNLHCRLEFFCPGVWGLNGRRPGWERLAHPWPTRRVTGAKRLRSRRRY